MTTDVQILHEASTASNYLFMPFGCGQITLALYTCSRCPFQTNALLLLRYHIRESHTQISKEEPLAEFYKNPVKKYTCKGCDFATYTLLENLKHDECRTKVGVEESFECGLCPHVTKHKKNLKIHYLIRHVDEAKIRWLQCDYCDFKAKVRDNLQKHLKKHFRKKYKCDKCGFKANDSDLLQHHLQTRHAGSVEWFHCEKCSFKSRYRTGLRHHYLLKHINLIPQLFDCEIMKLVPYSCLECSFQTDVLVQLKIHMARLHSAKSGCQSLLRGTTQDSLKKYICDGCSFETYSLLCGIAHRCRYWTKIRRVKERYVEEYSHKWRRRRYLETRSDICWFHCVHCDYKTDIKKNLTTHMNRRHPDETKAPWLKCDLCSYATKIHDDLLRHVTHVHLKKIEWFECDRCPFRSKHKGDLKLHALKHSDGVNVDWFQCDQCDYKTKLEGKLARHRDKKHADDSGDVFWFNCAYCDYKARERRYLLGHINRLHPRESKAAWLKCDRCEYTTKSRDSLTKHVKCKHTEKHLKCDECPFATKHERNLKKHKVVKHKDVTPVQWLECDRCDFETNSEKRLAHHRNVGHSEKVDRFRCGHCDYKAKEKRHLVAHVNTVHPDESSAAWRKCDSCDFSTKSRDSFNKHNKYKHGETRWKCDRCSFTTKYEQSFKAHILQKHRNLTPI